MKIFFVLLQDFLSGVLCLICISCNPESSRIGADFFRDGSLDLSSIDSVTVKLSTVKFDSLVTGQSGRILVGTHVDEKLGRITASTYFKPALPGDEVPDNSNIFFDQLSVVLKYEGYAYYDTSALQTFYVYQLNEEMVLSGDGQLYNTTHFALREMPLGSVALTPKPHSKDSVELVLDKSFGEEFFTKARQGGTDFTNNDRFGKFIKGFAVVSDTTVSAAIIGFVANPTLRLYYFDRSQVPTQRKFITYNTSTGYQSTHIKVNRSNTLLGSLRDYKTKLSSVYTDDEAYLQAGAGLSLRIDMPYLRSLKAFSNFFITKAVLQIQPVHKSYNKVTRLPDTLNVHMVNNHNATLGNYSSGALLREDLSTGRDTYYEIDATAFVRSQMALEELNENALLLLLPDEDFRTGTERIYFASPSFQYNTRLIISYATISN